MIDLLIFSIICFSISKFIWSVYTISGAIDYIVQRTPNSYYEKLFSCQFCLSFRFNVLLALTSILIFDLPLSYLLAPIMATGFISFNT